ncbi:hypothetical protein BDN72DRAFT_893970 [Pluteus cervinus]|uniref:Uncharacterized protein n=1 Tax=Pluteus cervinus TaxID=181527 RepID=A0ACD3B6M3_9AGAR|nr:hypothetical protein BDN72DRAFT_893970 [Pluteus cervinus]
MASDPSPPQRPPLTPFSQLSHPKAGSAEYQEDADTTSTSSKRGSIKNWLIKQADKHKTPLFYIPRISATIILLLAPWILYGVVSHHGQLTLGHSAADQIASNSRIVTHVVVTLAGIVASAVTYLFGAALVCVVQKWASRPPSTVPTNLMRPVRIRYLGQLANIGRLRLIFAYNSWEAVAVSALAVVLYAAGNQLLAGISAMFTPQVVSLTTPLTGSEIDFSATDSTCINWYTNASQSLTQDCGYTVLNGFMFTTCLGENQLTEVIQAGRDNAVLLNSSAPNTFPRLNGTRFLGSFPGVLVTGPNGMNPFGPVYLDDVLALAGPPGTVYNYTLPLQGISLDVNCAYKDDTIVGVQVLPLTDTQGNPAAELLVWNSTCPAGTLPFHNSEGDYQTFATDKSMGIWACKQNPPNNRSLSYSIYLHGVNDYRQAVGNMTCTVDVALADYEIEYLGAENSFRTNQGPNITDGSPNVFTSVFDDVIWSAVGVGTDSQTANAGNLVTEAVLAIGAEYYGLDQTARSETYTMILSNILQGMLSYQSGYHRLVLSRGQDILPPDCFRTIAGNVHYLGIGWATHSGQFDSPFLLGYTAVLLLALIMYCLALCMPEPWDSWDPTDPTDVCAAASRGELVFTKLRGQDGEDAYVTRPLRAAAPSNV